MKRIFISREITEKSTLNNLEGCIIIGESLLTFSPIPYTLPDCEWIFFYSQKGVQYFLEQQSIPKDKKIGAIGPKTAEALSRYGVPINFIGNGDPDATANEFECIKGKTCFVRAKTSSNKIKNKINDPDDNDIIVYDNVINNEAVPSGDFDILVFTSTKNAQAFFKARAYKEESIIAIGKPTQEYILSLGYSAICPEVPSEESIYKLLITSFI